MERVGILGVNAIMRTTAVAAILAFILSFSNAPASALAGGDFPEGMSIGGLQRTYLVHVPAGLDHPNGLVINLHGSGMTGGQQAAATNYNAIADQHGFVVVYPDGIDASWADGRGASVPDRQGVDDVGFLVTLADRLIHDYGIDPGRVFATGMSAGAFMANRLACERADVVAAIAPVAGTLGSAFPMLSVATRFGAAGPRTADPVVPFNGGPMVGRGGASDIVGAPALSQRWRDLDGCASPVVDVPAPNVNRFTAAGCSGGTEVSFIQIDGGGHTWFDAAPASAQFFAIHGR